MTQIDTSTEAVERLSPYAVDGGYDAFCEMEPDEHGDYVRHEDYVTLLAERDTLRRERDEARNAALNEAQRAVVSADPQENLDPRDPAMRDNPYLKAWRAIEVLKSSPAPRKDCPECGGSGMCDSGGVQPWGEHIDIPCDCAHSQSRLDDEAVDRFAAAMKAKLAQKRAEGRGGWDNKAACSQEFLSFLLREHVEKGDPVDVANFAMMLHQRGEEIMLPAQEAPRPSVQEAAKVLLDLSTVMKHAFLSGFVAAREIPGHEECNGNRHWVDYAPYEPGAYTRVIRALAQKEGQADGH